MQIYEVSFTREERRTRLAPDRSQTDLAMEFLRSNNGQRLSIAVFALAATAVVIAFPGSYAAYAFGMPLLFFVPGFATVRLVFWKRTSLEAKFVLSLGLSIIVIILLGLALVLTPIGLDSNTTRGSVLVYTLVVVALETFWKPVPIPDKKPEKRPQPVKVDKVVAAMIATALGVSVVSLGLIITAEYPSRTYFAMTDEYGNATIPSVVDLGTNMTFVIEMHNGEDGPRDFLMLAHNWNSSIFGERWYNNTLEKGETITVEVVFELNVTGVYRLDFDLYIQEEGEEPELYGNLHHWVSVR